MGALTALRRCGALVGATVLVGATLAATAAVAQGQSLPKLSVADVTVEEGNRAMVFTVRMDRAASRVVEVEYETQFGTADASDFLPTAGTLRFRPGQRTARIVVTVLEDTVPEAPETFSLELWYPRYATGATEPTDAKGPTLTDVEATGTITDDDDRWTDLTVDNSVDFEGRELTFWVTLDVKPGQLWPVEVDYRTVNGTAAAPSDFPATNGKLTFNEGENPWKEVSVTLESDDLDEDLETFGLRLTNARNASAPRDAASGVIEDRNPSTRLTVSNFEGEEGVTFNFKLTLDKPSGREVIATYATCGRTAAAGADYRAVTGVLRFPPGVTERTVSVRTIDDARDEVSPEVFDLMVLSLTNALPGEPVEGDPGSSGPFGAGTIIDDDGTEEDAANPDTGPDTCPDTNFRVSVSSGGQGGTGTGTGGQGGTGTGTGGGQGGTGTGGGLLVGPAVVTPRIKALVNDVVLRIGAPPFVLDLATVMGAATDSHRALAADPRVVTVVVSGSRMTLSAVATGVTKVTITASNSKGSAVQSFEVTVVGAEGPPTGSPDVTIIERSAPAIVTLLGQQTLTVGDPPTVLDVAAAFGRPLGATYRATADDPRLVTVVVSGPSLSLTGLTPGTTTVSISAHNASGSARQTIRVTIRA